MTAPQLQRRRAYVVAYRADPCDRVRSFEVKCPFCRGRHQHATSNTSDYALPYCGAFAGYEVVWPALASNDTPESDSDPARNLVAAVGMARGADQ